MIDLFGEEHKPLTRRTPLKYVGGKSYAIDIIRQCFPPRLTEMVSPFCGGCSIELACAADGVRIHAYDLYGDLINFWIQLQSRPEQLWDIGSQYLTYDTDEFKAYLNQYKTETDPLTKAAIFYGLRKSSYAGMMTGLASQLRYTIGYKHGWRRKFTKASPSVMRVKTFHNPNISFQVNDFETALNNHPNVFAYLDPPYMIKSKTLYGCLLYTSPSPRDS